MSFGNQSLTDISKCMKEIDEIFKERGLDFLGYPKLDFQEENIPPPPILANSYTQEGAIRALSSVDYGNVYGSYGMNRITFSQFEEIDNLRGEEYFLYRNQYESPLPSFVRRKREIVKGSVNVYFPERIELNKRRAKERGKEFGKEVKINFMTIQEFEKLNKEKKNKPKKATGEKRDVSTHRRRPNGFIDYTTSGSHSYHTRKNKQNFLDKKNTNTTTAPKKKKTILKKRKRESITSSSDEDELFIPGSPASPPRKRSKRNRSKPKKIKKKTKKRMKSNKNKNKNKRSSCGRSFFLDEDGVGVLEKWFVRNVVNPYPTKEDKDKLSRKSGFSIEQVCNWFSNIRKRKWLLVKKLIDGDIDSDGRKGKKILEGIIKTEFGNKIYLGMKKKYRGS